MFRSGFAGCVCVAAIISGEAFSQERTCPNSSKDFIVGEATKGFIKQCLGTPDVDKPLNDGRSLYFYLLEQATKSSMIYEFDSSERLVTYHLKSHKGGDAEGLLARRDRERMATKVAAQQADIRAATEEKERQARIKKESGLSAQSMYLQAGKYDRNGQQSDAVRLYELLIEKFPSSPLAVQATNRLVAIQADEKASNSSKPSNTECSHLYIGKAVSYKGCGALWCTTVEGVITGIGDGVATMRVTGSEYNGDVIEKSCSKF